MNTVIAQLPLKLIIFFLIISCHASKNLDHLRQANILLPTGKLLSVTLLFSEQEQVKGLSGVHDLEDNKAVAFYYSKDDYRNFWMPDTYINLDIIFLDANWRILYAARNMQAHPGYTEPPTIARTPTIYARHVLEIKSSSPLAAEMKVGTVLKWANPTIFEQIKSNIHLLK